MARTLYIDADLVDFSAHPAYQLDFLGDWEAYFATAYFVDPAIICSGGRTAEEFEIQGVGDRLAIQVKDMMREDEKWLNRSQPAFTFFLEKKVKNTSWYRLCWYKKWASEWRAQMESYKR